MGVRIQINQEECIGCGTCVAICPYRVITLDGKKAARVEKDCFLCGHCYAVCPVEAVTLQGLRTEVELLGRMKGLYSKSVSFTDLVSLMQSRRSCRKYKSEAVPIEILKDLVAIGTTAPSGTNSQGWNFFILPERKDVMTLGELVGGYYKKLNRKAESSFLRGLVRLLGRDSLGRYYRNYYHSVKEALLEWEESGVDRLFHGAPSAILISGKTRASCPQEDALLATQNILLAAQSIGLGSCLIGFAVEAMRRDSSIGKKMQIPQDDHIYSVVALGYPDVEFLRPAGRKEIVPRIMQF